MLHSSAVSGKALLEPRPASRQNTVSQFASNSRPRGVGPNRSRRSAINSMAFLASKQAETVKLPLDFYLLLKVNPGVSRESVTRAYEKCLADPPTSGYSTQALDARATILEGAHETLASSAKRRDYDDRFRLGAVSEDIPSDYVAATLMLLQESGDSQTVVAAGEAWLASHRRHRSARDVALATALAHCDLATAHLEAHGSVEQACAMLDVAGKVLRQHRAGTPQLLSDIEGAAAELQPQLALELVSRLDDPHARARGMDFLPSALESLASKPDEGRRGELSRKLCLERLREVLTAEEHVALYTSAGPAYASSPAELYHAALAHISAGCASYKPLLIRCAADILATAEAADADAEIASSAATVDAPRAIRDRRVIDDRHRRAVASCVAALLLGDSGAAGDALGLRDGRLKCDRQVLAYIKANSPDATSLLPGVCALVQRWVSDVALTAYRPATRGAVLSEGFSLDAWFESPEVLRELEAPASDLPKPLAVLGALFAAPFAAISELFFMPKDASESVGAVKESEEVEEEIVAPAAAATAAIEVAPSPPKACATPTHAAAPVPVPVTPSTPAVVASEEKTVTPTMRTTTTPAVPPPQKTTVASPTAPANPARSTSFEEALAAETAAFYDDDDNLEADNLADEDDDFMTQPMTLESIKPLRGEDAWMRGAYQTRSIRWGRLAGAVALLAGGTALAIRAALPMINPHPVAPSAASMQLASEAGAKIISRGEAASVVSKWQKVKAAALGPKHVVDGLSSILRGDLLNQWHERSSQLLAKGWHYTHDLHTCKVLDVVPGNALNTAIVTAAMKEGVTVHKGSEVEPQMFLSEYQVVYQVAKEDGGWVLTGAVIQGP